MNLAPIPTFILTPAVFAPTPYAATSLAEAATKEPNGVYTLARTYRRDHALLFDDHIDRLEESARLMGLHVTIDRPALRRALATLIDGSGYTESRFRITIPIDSPDSLILSLEPYKPVPPEIIEGGARCATVQLARHNPAAKTTAWIAARAPATANLPAGVYEGILVSPEGVLSEGLSSNFYAIMNGALHTAGEGALAGMAQKIVLRIAPEMLPVMRTPITIRDLPFIDEAFISSAGRGIVPVIMLDNQIISTGHPGTVTLALRDRYQAWADAYLERIAG